MKESVQRKQENLQLLSEEIVRPKYDRSRMKAGIVHIGVGGFHRSHEGEHFKLGATRRSSEFASPVQFAFPDTNERRSPGVGH
jgi:mannitol-1-phosphate/altronate dehydrogenase